jgi:PPOX class probable F420-dependent enzyme
MDWNAVAAHLTGQAHLATIRPDGSPHVSKVWPAVDGQTVWIGTRAGSGKAHNVRANPEAALMFEPRAEVYLSGGVEVVSDPETKRQVWASGIFEYPLESFFGSPDRDDFVFLKVTPRQATVMLQGESGIRRETWQA